LFQEIIAKLPDGVIPPKDIAAFARAIEGTLRTRFLDHGEPGTVLPIPIALAKAAMSLGVSPHLGVLQ